jgi:hypothetical protein
MIRWAPRPDQSKKFIYEERITAWNAESLDAAIELAESEARGRRTTFRQSPIQNQKHNKPRHPTAGNAPV